MLWLWIDTRSAPLHYCLQTARLETVPNLKKNQSKFLWIFATLIEYTFYTGLAPTEKNNWPYPKSKHLQTSKLKTVPFVNLLWRGQNFYVALKKWLFAPPEKPRGSSQIGCKKLNDFTWVSVVGPGPSGAERDGNSMELRASILVPGRASRIARRRQRHRSHIHCPGWQVLGRQVPLLQENGFLQKAHFYFCQTCRNNRGMIHTKNIENGMNFNSSKYFKDFRQRLQKFTPAGYEIWAAR